MGLGSPSHHSAFERNARTKWLGFEALSWCIFLLHAFCFVLSCRSISFIFVLLVGWVDAGPFLSPWWRFHGVHASFLLATVPFHPFPSSYCHVDGSTTVVVVLENSLILARDSRPIPPLSSQLCDPPASLFVSIHFTTVWSPRDRPLPASQRFTTSGTGPSDPSGFVRSSVSFRSFQAFPFEREVLRVRPWRIGGTCHVRNGVGCARDAHAWKAFGDEGAEREAQEDAGKDAAARREPVRAASTSRTRWKERRCVAW